MPRAVRTWDFQVKRLETQLKLLEGSRGDPVIASNEHVCLQSENIVLKQQLCLAEDELKDLKASEKSYVREIANGKKLLKLMQVIARFLTIFAKSRPCTYG